MLRFASRVLSFIALISAGNAQEVYPSRPITMIVPFAAGGASDIIARVIGEEMGKALGQRIIHENVPGAGGSTALTRLARAAPDGYVIAIGNSGTNAAVYTIYKDLAFKPDAFAPIGLVARTAAMIAVKKDLPQKDVAALAAYARQNPGKLTFGHAGVGSSNYLICKMFLQAAGIDITLVAYRGAAPALQDLIGGQIDGVCDNATSLAGAVQAGQVHGLVVSAAARLATMPGVPTSEEAGLAAFQAQGWNALFAPRGAPGAVMTRLNEALRAAMQSELLRKRYADIETTAAAGDDLSPEYLNAYVPAEIEKFRKLLAE